MKRKNCTLRKVRDEDHNFLLELFASTREKELAMVPWSDEQKKIFITQQHNAQHTHYMQSYTNGSFDIIEDDETPVGRLYVDRGAEDIRIIDISLLPSHRNRGIGTHYLSTLLTESEKSGKPVTIHVEKENPARSLYERLGFQIKDDLGVYLFLERPVGVIKNYS